MTGSLSLDWPSLPGFKGLTRLDLQNNSVSQWPPKFEVKLLIAAAVQLVGVLPAWDHSASFPSLLRLDLRKQLLTGTSCWEASPADCWR